MLIEQVRKVLADVHMSGCHPVTWIMGMDFTAAFENLAEYVRVARISELDMKDLSMVNTMAGIPFIKSPYVKTNKAFLLDRECNVIKTIEIEVENHV